MKSELLYMAPKCVCFQWVILTDILSSWLIFKRQEQKPPTQNQLYHSLLTALSVQILENVPFEPLTSLSLSEWSLSSRHLIAQCLDVSLMLGFLSVAQLTENTSLLGPKTSFLVSFVEAFPSPAKQFLVTISVTIRVFEKFIHFRYYSPRDDTQSLMETPQSP